MLLTNTLLSQFSYSLRFMTLLLVIALIPVSAQGEQKQDACSAELQKLIRAVAQNETLYQNLRLQLTCSEVAHAGWFLHDDSIKVKRQSTIALTVQGEKFAERTQTSGDFVKHLTGGLGWLKEGFRDSASRTVKEETRPFQIRTGTRTITSVFDGTSYQYFMEDKLRNQGATEPPRLEQDGMISDQSPGLTDLARPHMFLFEPA
ncbi:MAG TPA: hypothetical protein DCM07_12150, partial [Planctomycetaceae bacterium]|nr:hypothetical protein [Planctomycetaceae bacterium]